MLVVVRLPSALRVHGDGAAEVAIDVTGSDVTVKEVLDALGALHPGIDRRIRDEQGALRRHVNLFLGRDEDFRRAHPGSAVPQDAELVVLPAVSGGARLLRGAPVP